MIESVCLFAKRLFEIFHPFLLCAASSLTAAGRVTLFVQE